MQKMSEESRTLSYERQGRPGMRRISIVWGLLSALFGAISGLGFLILPIILIRLYPRFDTPFIRHSMLVVPVLTALVTGVLGAVRKTPGSAPRLEVTEISRECPECHVVTAHLVSTGSSGAQRFGCKRCGLITMQRAGESSE
jgi:endogenous inhibitor of DNA gyrase (YacG/DUF329 family)